MQDRQCRISIKRTAEDLVAARVGSWPYIKRRLSNDKGFGNEPRRQRIMLIWIIGWEGRVALSRMISRRWRASIRGLSIWITSNRVTPWLVNNPPHVVPLPDYIRNLHNGGKLVHIPAAVKIHPVLPLTLQSNGKPV